MMLCEQDVFLLPFQKVVLGAVLGDKSVMFCASHQEVL